jgi:hypothetical protein
MPLELFDVIPFKGTPSQVQSSGTTVVLQANQVLLWVTFAPPTHSQKSPPHDALRWPALLDSGHTHNFSIREEQAGLTEPQIYHLLDEKRPLTVDDSHGGQVSVPRLLGNLWLHSSWRGHRRPYRIHLGNSGIAFYRTSGVVSGPRLPLLGIGALCAGRMGIQVMCHPAGGEVALWVPVEGARS